MLRPPCRQSLANSGVVPYLRNRQRVERIITGSGLGRFVVQKGLHQPLAEAALAVATLEDIVVSEGRVSVARIGSETVAAPGNPIEVSCSPPTSPSASIR